jgi:type VI secretion system secreted protein VgrG
VIETAIVTGPEGAEIHADDHGRVKVRFLWDRAGTPDDRSSCWIRTSQLWSGEAWGAQFVPRVGMEVIVGFVQGDPDQPVILGCVPNAVRRLPFGTPTKSGVVTRSTPGGKVRNELSFEDRQGSEEVLLAAGRDLTVTSARNMATLVGGAQATDVRGSSEEKISGERVAKIGGDARETVDGSKAEKVALGWTRRAGTDIVESAGADYQLSVGKGYTLSVSGILGTTVGTPDEPSVASTFVHGDHLVRTSGTVKLSADQGISLVCGESRIDVRPDGVRIQAASVTVAGKEAVVVKGKGPSLSLSDTAVLTADKVQIFAEKGQILLDKHARMNGETVKLNCSDEAAPPRKDDGEPVEMRPFRTKLTDHSFSPYKDRTYHLVADGVRYEGKTTAEGLVDKPIPKDTKLIEITVWTGDYPQGERQLFVIRRGYSAPDSVEGAQSRLASLGYLKGARSGAMDDATRDALYSFQLDAGLPATGVLDAATAGKLAAVQGG